MKDIVIIIDGVRHVACYSGRGCLHCSLSNLCPYVIGSPCNSKINHFKFE